MAHWLFLSLLLAPIQLKVSSNNEDKFTLTCPGTWNITCKNMSNVLHLQCNKSGENMILSMNYTGQDPTGDCCFKMESDKKFMLDIKPEPKEQNKCCKDNYVPCKTCNRTGDEHGSQDCQENLYTKSLTTQTSPLTVDIKTHGIECRINDSVLIGTGQTSLTLFRDAKNWIEALEDCQKSNSSLVQIINQTVQDNVTSLLTEEEFFNIEAWVGLERSIFGTDVKWKWISGIQAEWNNISGNNLNHHCGTVRLGNDTKNIQLLDEDCQKELPYICQAGSVSTQRGALDNAD